MIHNLLKRLLIARAILVASIDAIRNPLRTEPRAPSRRWWRLLMRKTIEYGMLFAALGVVGFLVAVSGVIPIKASSGHWAITHWMLALSMERSVATHTIGKDAPRLDDRALIIKGAGAYETGCRPCHGSPDVPEPRVAHAMLPQPPYLPARIKEWTPEELFYITKHGVKFTGMPAWPALQRDDEVWAIVAFLLVFPGLDSNGYRALVQGERPVPPLHGRAGPAVPSAVLETCTRCHGIDGRGRGVGAFPKLAGQRPGYLLHALRAFENGRRHSGMMEPIAAALTPRQMGELARYYGGMSDLTAELRTSSNDEVTRGKLIATRGIPEHDVPACAQCHGPSPTRKNAAYPVLSGQYAGYLILQLELFQQQRRGGSPYAHLMRRAAAGLTRSQMREVALYYESLGDKGAALQP